MTSLKPRAVPGQLSTTAIAAIITGIGVVLLCLLISLIFLLVRAVRRHKQLLADLDERGVSLAQAQKDAEGDGIARPRSVIRRNTILPFNKDGWGALPSNETFGSVESANGPTHYVPKKPPDEVKKSRRLSWPCSTRRVSGHNVQMKKIKASRLSTVIEDPKNSPQGLVMSMPHLNGSRTSLGLPMEYANRPPLRYSLSQQHPAFRNSKDMEPVPASTEEYVPSDSSKQAGSYGRLQRAKSVADVQFTQPSRPQLRVRSTSLSQIPGRVPDVLLPPLPPNMSQSQGDTDGGGQLGRAPSKLSVSSFGSADTTILATRPSPNPSQSTKPKPRKITKPNAKGSKFAGSRPFRDTFELRTRPPESGAPLQSSSSRTSMISEGPQELQYSTTRGTLSARSSTNSLASSHRMHSMTLARLSTPLDSPTTIRSQNNTPKRKLMTQVSSSGSPERQIPNSSSVRNMNGAMRSPKRQHSQTSSRSSGGNPFQWDPTPLSPSGKPSALKGSPSARKGHRRKNSVRISLVPTVHPPPSRTPSPSCMIDSRDDATGGAPGQSASSASGKRLSGPRSLPTPPSSSTFAPDLKFNTTTLRGSLTSTSPTLPLTGYDQNFIVSSTDPVLPPLSSTEQKRLSNGSCFSLSQFPTTPSIIEPEDIDLSQLDTIIPARSDSIAGPWVPDAPLLQQYPFPSQSFVQDRSPSPTNMIDIDEYNPEQPNCIYRTPPASNVNSRSFHSAFATIPEESSVSSNKTSEAKMAQDEDSPPVSPKTISPPRFNIRDDSVNNLPVQATVIPEEPADTINPAILTKDAFSLLNSSFGTVPGSDMLATPNGGYQSTAVPPTPGSSQSMIEPLLDLDSSLGLYNTYSMDSPTLASLEGDSSVLNHSFTLPNLSATSSCFDSPILPPPCSPRPRHSDLPVPRLSINFAELPRLTPSPRGPRSSPPRPLGSSIAALRRMNSDAADAKESRAGRGERRYLRLGREASLRLPGDESWLDELEDEDAVELDEEESRRLVGNVLEGWEAGYTKLDADEGNTSTLSDATVKPSPITPFNVPERGSPRGLPHSSSQIWEDNEKFWTSPPTSSRPQSNSPQSNSPQSNRSHRHSSPRRRPSSNTSSPSSKSPSRKREFRVAKDHPPSPTENLMSNPDFSIGSGKSRRDSRGYDVVNDSGNRRGSVPNPHRKRHVLGIGTPNVRIQVTSPSGQVTGHGSPGYMYDSQGFLIF